MMLLAITPALCHKASERSKMVSCFTNLHGIAMALIEYSNKNNGKYPRTNFDPNSSVLVEYTGVDATDPFGPGGPQVNDVSAPMWLLLRVTGMSPRFLVCPVSDADPYDPATAGLISYKSNFPSRQNLTYSLQCPYPTMNAVKEQWAWDTSSISSDAALAADMNPGTPALLTVSPKSTVQQLRPANSQIHSGFGQNVLYGDYHVAFMQTPFCGSVRDNGTSADYDNIYTSQTSPPTLGGQPQDVFDSVLLPLATAGFQPPPNSHVSNLKSRSSSVATAVVGVLIVGAIVMMLISVKGRNSVAQRPRT